MSSGMRDKVSARKRARNGARAKKSLALKRKRRKSTRADVSNSAGEKNTPASAAVQPARLVASAGAIDARPLKRYKKSRSDAKDAPETSAPDLEAGLQVSSGAAAAGTRPLERMKRSGADAYKSAADGAPKDSAAVPETGTQARISRGQAEQHVRADTSRAAAKEKPATSAPAPEAGPQVASTDGAKARAVRRNKGVRAAASTATAKEAPATSTPHATDGTQKASADGNNAQPPQRKKHVGTDASTAAAQEAPATSAPVPTPRGVAAPPAASSGTGVQRELPKWRGKDEDNCREGPFTECEKEQVLIGIQITLREEGIEPTEAEILKAREATMVSPLKPRGQAAHPPQRAPPQTCSDSSTNVDNRARQLRTGEWTEDELQLLESLVESRGHKWTEIGMELGRYPGNCKDKWRDHVQFKGSRNVGHPSRDEEEKLAALIVRALGPDPTPASAHSLPWTAISREMGTRSYAQCLTAGRTILKRLLPAPEMPIKEIQQRRFEYKLVHELIKLTDCEDETDIPWGGMLPKKPGYQCEEAWGSILRRFESQIDMRKGRLQERLMAVVTLIEKPKFKRRSRVADGRLADALGSDLAKRDPVGST